MVDFNRLINPEFARRSATAVVLGLLFAFVIANPAWLPVFFAILCAACLIEGSVLMADNHLPLLLWPWPFAISAALAGIAGGESLALTQPVLSLSAVALVLLKLLVVIGITYAVFSSYVPLLMHRRRHIVLLTRLALYAIIIGLVFAQWFTIADHFAYLKNIALPMVAVVVVFDVCAYLGGKLYGRHKLLPVTSPGKTWEGLLIGLVFALMAALWLMPPMPLWLWFLNTLLLLLLAFAGDYLESRMKRLSGRKNSGFLLPGHGGFLDRFDSFLLIPFLWPLWWQTTAYTSAV